MQLYHFTAQPFLSSIEESGLTIGRVPIITKGKFVGWLQPMQWLTLQRDFEDTSQPTDPSHRQLRLTIEIPEHAMEHLVSWEDLCAKNEILFGSYTYYIKMFGHTDKWFVFRGVIKPAWIKEIECNPAYAKATDTPETPGLESPKT